MKFNQFSYIPVSPEMACQELHSLGFEVSLDASAKANFEAFVRKHFLFFEDTDLALKNWIADMQRLISPNLLPIRPTFDC